MNTELLRPGLGYRNRWRRLGMPGDARGCEGMDGMDVWRASERDRLVF